MCLDIFFFCLQSYKDSVTNRFFDEMFYSIYLFVAMFKAISKPCKMKNKNHKENTISRIFIHTDLKDLKDGYAASGYAVVQAAIECAGGEALCAT